MLATDAASAAATWRPQLFGDQKARQIADPIVEPLWTGPRILAFVDATAVSLTDVDGDPIDNEPNISTDLREAAGGATLLLEAFLTPEYAELLELVAAERRAARRRGPDLPPIRWREAVTAELLALLRAGQRETVRQRLQATLGTGPAPALLATSD